MTKYRSQCGNRWGNGKWILPLADEEALKWLEEHDGTEIAEE